MIFSGTTEGRKLSELLCADGIKHHVCVATSYGSDVMAGSRYAVVHTGRMDEDEMCAFLSKEGFGPGDTVVDATHPYAGEVSNNIRRAAERAGCSLIRVKRASLMKALGSDAKNISVYDTMADFARFAGKTHGNILLATGSRDLPDYCKSVSEETLGRTYVRIIPSVESLESVTALGIKSSHVIAMQGPFSYELNRAVLRQYGICHMLTKDSGDEGGFTGKIRAATDLLVSCHVLRRPCEEENEEGETVGEAYRRITGSDPKDVPSPQIPEKRRITLAGIGMGSAGIITPEAAAAIRSADALFGAASVLDRACRVIFPAGADVPQRFETYRGGDITDILGKEVDIRSAAVLFSGDSGFYSGAAACRRSLAQWDEHAEITVLPGISSVSYLASRVKESYDDAKIISVHGDVGLHNIGKLINAVTFSRKTFALLSGPEDIKIIASHLKDAAIPVRICVGSDLSMPDESIGFFTVDEALEEEIGGGMITVLFINEKPRRRRILSMCSDDDFIREKIPMTKECIRHESIIRLDPHEGDFILDVGGGTGSVAIETAALDPSLKVVTIEKDPAAAALIRRNIEKSHLLNVSVMEGDAADMIPDIECPDRVFIGGSGGRLSDIISALAGKRKGIRYVVTAVSLETMDEVRQITEKADAEDVRALQISVSDIETVGDHHMFRSNNPVTIFTFTV